MAIGAIAAVLVIGILGSLGGLFGLGLNNTTNFTPGLGGGFAEQSSADITRLITLNTTSLARLANAAAELKAVAAGVALVKAYRHFGHMSARLDPLGADPPPDPVLEPSRYGLAEADLAQLHANAFIETCEPWAVPYIGDLVGWTPIDDGPRLGTRAGDDGPPREREHLDRDGGRPARRACR